MSERVLVTGGRNYRASWNLNAVLDRLHAERGIAELIHGACPTGADALADAWAVSRGIEPVRCPADWERFGKAAGPMRNTAMLQHHPTLVVAFPGGTGTADMVKKAKRSLVEVMEVA